MKTLTLPVLLFVITLNITYAQNIAAKDLNCKDSFELIQKYKGDSNFVLLDLRPENMFKDEHIEGAIFFDVFSDKFNDWAKTLNKEKVYFLYCTIGHRSKIALDKMKEMGFKTLYNLEKGIKEWKSEGYKTSKDIVK